MASSSITNTTLEVGALIVPVGLKKMSESSDIRLDRASAAGNKIGRKEFDKVTGETVDAENPPQYGRFVGEAFTPISQDALDAIEAETKIDSFEVTDFVPLSEVPFERATAAYYVVPQSGVSAKPLALLYKALAKTKRAGVFKMVLRTRQYLAVVYAKDGALYINTLTFASDFKRAQEAKDVIAHAEQPNAKMVEAAAALIEALAADGGVIDAQVDDLVPLRQKLLDDALAGRKVTKRDQKAKPKVTGEDALEAALTASVEQARKRKPRQKAKV